MIKFNALRRFVKDTRGANMVEYILLVGVVALISIVAFKTFGSKVQEKIKQQGDTVGAINAGSGELAARSSRASEDLAARTSDVKRRLSGREVLLSGYPEFSCCWPHISWRRRWSWRPSRP